MSVKVAVVNAFGRGDTLAVELAQNGFEVHHFDLTSQLGNWALEDIQGPFGYLRFEPMDQLLVEQFHYSDAVQYLPRGLCFWGSKGPMETKNPLFDGIINEFAEKHTIGRSELQDQFEKAWPLLFLSSWNSIYEWTWTESSFPNKYKRWLYEFGFVHPTRQGLERRLTWFEEKGIHNYRNFQLLDFASQGKLIRSLELEGPERGLQAYDEIVWCLSLEQTRFLRPKLATKLFGSQRAEPDFAWMRYRFELDEKEELKYLPPHMVLIKDEFDIWTHANLVIMQRTPLKGFWDIWCKVPAHQRFSASYVDDIRDKVTAHIEDKLPMTKVLSIILPTESQYGFEQLGPSPYSTYRHAVDIKSPWQNLHFHGPETRFTYGLNELQEKNHQLIANLKNRREERKQQRSAEQ